MRRIILLVGLVVMVAAPVVAVEGYPITNLAEDVTATWCGYCPNAYAGLEIVHDQFDYSEFISARYYATSGGLGTPETDAAIAYYGAGSYPTVILNGTQFFVGAGTSTAVTGQPYLGAVADTMLTASPIRIEIDSFDPETGDISATVTMYSTTDELVDDQIRFVLLEHDVTYESTVHTRVTRDIFSDTISLAGVGNTALVNGSFNIDPGWVTDNLRAVVFVQREERQDKEILQAASSYPQPEYKIRGMVEQGAQMQMGASTSPFVGEDFAVTNVGLSDSFTINVIVDEAPPGWTISYVDDQGGNHQGEWSFVLGTGEILDFYAIVTPNSPGYMRYHFEVNSPNLPSPLLMSFAFITDDLNCLIVDADGGDPYEEYFREALDSSGWSYGVWNLGMSKLTPEVLQAYSLLIWNEGFASPTLDATDREFLMQHLDGGGNLFLSGQDIGWDLNENHGAEGIAFYHDYLHATYDRDDTNIMYLDGVLEDPITDGLDLHIAGGDGANNQAYPDEIAARDADATEILHYQGDGAGAIRVIDSLTAARIVYTGFGFEGIDNADDRYDLLIPAINWLQPLLEDGFESGDFSAWSNVSP